MLGCSELLPSELRCLLDVSPKPTFVGLMRIAGSSLNPFASTDKDAFYRWTNSRISNVDACHRKSRGVTEDSPSMSARQLRSAREELKGHELFATPNPTFSIF